MSWNTRLTQTAIALEQLFARHDPFVIFVALLNGGTWIQRIINL